MTLSRNLRFAVLAFFLWSLAYNLTTPLLPLFARELGATPAGMGSVGAATALGALVLIFPIARLSDRASRRTALLAGWTLSAGGFFLMSLARAPVALLPGAFLSAGALAALPALNALTIEELPRQQYTRGFALIYAAAPLGALCGSALAGTLSASHGLRVATAVAGVSVCVAALALLPIRESRLVDRLAPRSMASEAVAADPARPRESVPIANTAGIALALAAAGGFMLLSVPGNFIVPYLRDVANQSLVATGLLTALLSAAQFAWSLLFAVWPRRPGRVRIGPASARLAFPIASLQSLTLCLAANTLFGILLPLRGVLTMLVALALRGSQYTLQSLGSALLGDVIPAGRGLATRLTMFSVVLGLGAAAAPLAGGWLYGLGGACPFRLTAIAGAIGTALLLVSLRVLPKVEHAVAPQPAVAKN